MPDEVKEAQKDLKELEKEYRNVSAQIADLREQKHALSVMMAEKEEIIEASKRAGWGQTIG